MDIKMHGIRLQKNQQRNEDIKKSHFHKVFQILYVLEGSGEIIFDQQRNKLYTGCLAFIKPFSYHAVESKDKMTVLVLEFDSNHLDKDIKLLLEQEGLNRTKLESLSLFESANIKQLLRRILYEQKQGNVINIIAMKIYLAELLLIILKKEETNTVNSNSLRAETIKEYIDTNYFEDINNNIISKKIGITARYAYTIFKKQYGITPLKYLNTVRLEAAKLLLNETNKDITAICFEVGFDSISTFYRLFTEHTSIPPHKYRLK